MNKKQILKAYTIVSLFIYEIALFFIVGYFFGSYLDNRYGHENLFQMIIMLVGILVAMSHLIVGAIKLSIGLEVEDKSLNEKEDDLNE